MWHVKPWQYRRLSTALMESKKHVTSYSCSLDCVFRANNCHDDHKTTVDSSLIAKFVTDHLLYLTEFLLNPFVYARRLPKYRISYVLEKHKEGMKSERGKHKVQAAGKSQEETVELNNSMIISWVLRLRWILLLLLTKWSPAWMARDHVHHFFHEKLQLAANISLFGRVYSL